MNIKKKEVKTISYNLELSEDELEVLVQALGSVVMIPFSNEFGKENAHKMMNLYSKLRDEYDPQ
jgi:hypothetical protein